MPDGLHPIALGGSPAAHWPTHILRARSCRHFWEGVGTLSIKLFFGGTAYYDAGGGRFAVDDSSYLLLNHGQRYTITVETTRPLESFCLFFRAGLAEEVARSLRAHPATLLDAPDDAGPPVSFVERTYPHDTLLSPALLALRRDLPAAPPEPLWLDERLRGILERLFARHRETLAEVAAFPAARPATRDEIYRRLHRARDFLAASYDRPITLEETARVACLSPNHLLRSFRTLFGQTPHQLLTERRLSVARRLLVTTDLPVTEICFQVGFVSPGSFSHLFARKSGLSPERYRHAFR